MLNVQIDLGLKILSWIYCVLLGVIDTDLHSTINGIGLRGEDTFNAYLEMSAKKHPIGRNGLPEECASAIAFLEKETFITGNQEEKRIFALIAAIIILLIKINYLN